MIVLVFTNSNRVFPQGVSWISAKSGILVQEAGDESCYDLRTELTPRSNGTEICSTSLLLGFPRRLVLATTVANLI